MEGSGGEWRDQRARAGTERADGVRPRRAERPTDLSPSFHFQTTCGHGAIPYTWQAAPRHRRCQQGVLRSAWWGPTDRAWSDRASFRSDGRVTDGTPPATHHPPTPNQPGRPHNGGTSLARARRRHCRRSSCARVASLARQRWRGPQRRRRSLLWRRWRWRDRCDVISRELEPRRQRRPREVCAPLSPLLSSPLEQQAQRDGGTAARRPGDGRAIRATQV